MATVSNLFRIKLFSITFLIGIIFILCIILPLLSRDKSTDVTKRCDFRLPSSILPQHYDLQIQPFLIPDDFHFEGRINIIMTCMNTTDRITFHAKDLNIDESSATVKSEDGAYYDIFNLEYDDDNSVVTMELNTQLNINKTYHLSMKFSGCIVENDYGILTEHFVDKEGITHYVVYSSFEPWYAREAFPCFDEPELKATFNITIIRWKNMTAVSNMPKLKTISKDDEWEVDIFERSMRMSTYLVAIVVGNYAHKTKGRVTAWAPLNVLPLLDLALNMTVVTLEYFEKLLGIPYEAPKLDFVVLENFSVSGMENWGLVMYMRNAVSTNESVRDILWIELNPSIAILVIHEVAHQWFGNLVTMKWWNDLWLNEGISTYMEDIAFQGLYPELYDIDKEDILPYYISDCENEFSPVSKEKNMCTDQYYFDWISYTKAGYIIGMAHYVLGNETFWKGLNKYLKENSLKSVEEEDLWRTFNEVQQSSGGQIINMTERMTSWTHLQGIPIVTVTRDYETRTTFITQSSCKTSIKEKHRNDLWHIPISFSTAKNPEWNPKVTVWMETRKMIYNDSTDPNDWLLISGNYLAYFIINYDERNLNMLMEEVQRNDTVLTSIQSHKLLNDFYYFNREENDLQNFSKE